MSNGGPDTYRRLLAHAQWTWREEKVCPYHGPSRRKDRASGRADKRSARQAEQAEVANDNADVREMLSPDLCENGTCPFCHDGGNETDFERTRMGAAQRGAI